MKKCGGHVSANRRFIKHPCCPLEPRRVYSVDTKENYIEILRFKQFHDHFVFIEDEHNFKKKVLKKYFNVSVVVNLECGDTIR
jgi:hypothetical protein